MLGIDGAADARVRPVGSRLPLEYARDTGASFLTPAVLDAARAAPHTSRRVRVSTTNGCGPTSCRTHGHRTAQPLSARSSVILRRLVGVYNADGSVRGELTYFINARLGRAHCALV
jgi:hypothetical protein